MILGNIKKIKVGDIERIDKDQIPDVYKKKYKYRIINEYQFEDTNGNVIVVPEGFLCDGDSGPLGDIGYSWIFHDYLYSTHYVYNKRLKDFIVCDRKVADKIMVKVLLYEKRNVYSFFFDIVSQMNPFYLFSSSWERSGRRGPEYIFN